MALPLASLALVIAAHSAASAPLDVCTESELRPSQERDDGGALCEREVGGPRIRVPSERLVIEPSMHPARPSDAYAQFSHLPLLNTEASAHNDNNGEPAQARTQAPPFLFHAFAYLFMDGRGTVAFRMDAKGASEEMNALGGAVAEQSLHRSLLVHAGISF